MSDANWLRGHEAQFRIEIGPHAPGELAVLAFELDERMSGPFSLEATLVPGPDVEVDAEALVGAHACMTVRLDAERSRYVDGIVWRVRTWEEGAGAAVGRVRVTIVPELSRLGIVVRSRIFQELTVPEIVEQVLGEAGIARRFSLSGRYAARTYCVQYQESTFDFLRRLLEEEGIFWFFEHTQGGHTLVLADSAAVHAPVAGEPNLPFREPSRMATDREQVDAFSAVRELRPGKVMLRDYDHRRPALDLSVTREADGADASLEIYEYPGRYDDPQAGTLLSQVRLEEQRAGAELCAGTSDCPRLEAGYAFRLEDHPIAELNEEYVVITVRHRATQPEVVGGAGTVAPGTPDGYRNDFVCVRRAIPWRPARETPRPVIAGPQTAIVVGPPGEEIHTDPAGRIKVQFHWDREGSRDERSSCWMRVSQAWAGPGWGALYLPRIGHEVVVEFLEGDPDRPLVTGSVYNGANPPPISLPTLKTQSTLRSASSPGSEGFNELRFEDAKGQEEVYFHAQRDLSVVVENDRTERVGANDALQVTGNRQRRVGGDQRLEVGKDDTRTIGGNQTLTVQRDRSTAVAGSHAESVGGEQRVSIGADQEITVALAASESVGLAKALNVGGGYAVAVGGALTEVVGGMRSEDVAGAKTVTVGGDRAETVLGSRSLTVRGDVTEEVGRSRSLQVERDAAMTVGGNLRQQAARNYEVRAKRIVLQADDEFTLKVGAATLRMSKGGEVTLQGAKVSVAASGPLALQAASISEN